MMPTKSSDKIDEYTEYTVVKKYRFYCSGG